MDDYLTLIKYIFNYFLFAFSSLLLLYPQLLLLLIYYYNIFSMYNPK